MKYSVNRVSFPARQAAAPDERSNRRCFPAESTSRPDTAAKSDALMPLPLAIIVIACQRTSFANAASTVTGSSAGAPPAGEELLLIASQNCANQPPTQAKCRQSLAAIASTFTNRRANWTSSMCAWTICTTTLAAGGGGGGGGTTAVSAGSRARFR